jgi:hypothetical protein
MQRNCTTEASVVAKEPLQIANKYPPDKFTPSRRTSVFQYNLFLENGSRDFYNFSMRKAFEKWNRLLFLQ